MDAAHRPAMAPVPAMVVEEGWFPGPLTGGEDADLAVLALARHVSPAELGPAALGRCGEPDRRQVSVFGNPRAVPGGGWAVAGLTGRGGPHPDWIQLDGIGSTGMAIERGFSGAGVWDGDRVIGLITAAYTERAAKVSWMLPMEAAARYWPRLDPLLRQGARTPARGGEPPSDETVFALADALLEIPQVEEDNAAALRGLLPPAIRHNVHRRPTARLQVYYLVLACTRHRDGRRALAQALRLLDGESEPARAALDLLDSLWPLPLGGGAG